MAFIINKITSGQQPEAIATSIRKCLATSRFTADISNDGAKVKIQKVRLTYKKDYCGNHPLPCPVRPGIHRPHRRLNYLEGADWVAFNDFLNDILDSLRCFCNAASSHVIIRKEGARCMRYDAQSLRNGIDSEWKKDSGTYNLCISPLEVVKVVKASYPAGTPGFATAYGTPNYPEHEH